MTQEEVFSKQWDIAVVGGGPAGLSAAVNGAVRNKKVLLIEPREPGGKIAWAEKVNNYLGLPGLGGRELAGAFASHFQSFGVEVLKRRVEMVMDMGDGFVVNVGSGDLRARAVILAPGLVTQRNLPGEEEYEGRGVSYCATCDGPLYRDREVAVLAYSEEAAEEANFLSEICSRVYFVKSGAAPEGLRPEVTVIDGKPESIVGEEYVTAVMLEGGGRVPAEGVFILRQTLPVNRLLFGLEMDGSFVRVGRDQATSVAGVWAAGDCTGQPSQIAKAVGEGQVAALNAARYLDKLKSAK